MQFEALAKSFTKKDLPDSEIELTGDIPADVVAPYRDAALKHLAEDAEMPGFRKGHVPTELVLKKLGDLTVLEEAVELFMRDFYVELIQAHSIDAVGRPDIRITKLAPGNPVSVVIHTSVYPNIELPKHWKKIGEGVEIETVADILDAEIDEALTSIRRAHAKANATEPAQQPLDPASQDEAGSAPASPQSSQEPQQNPVASPQASQRVAAQAQKLAEPDSLPELNDEFAKSLGKFEGVEDLKTKLRENMKAEKDQKAKEARRGNIIEALLKETTLDVPTIFVESELEKIISQLREDTQRFGLSFEDYLQRVEKTEEQVRGEFREQATKRAKLQLVLNKIAEVENIEADAEAVETEIQHALEHFPDARPELVRIHVQTVLRNEKVLQMLEGTIK
ncbi:MAG TPA: trigger factor [Candidatus Paceibacterota bacterium]|nr:trigger factor [Candidatus Paceibacterota bacterium]